MMLRKPTLHSAMGGGKDVTKVDNALAVVDDYVVSKLK